MSESERERERDKERERGRDGSNIKVLKIRKMGDRPF